MYDIFTYIWLMFMVNVGKYTIHGSYGCEDVFSFCNMSGVFCLRSVDLQDIHELPCSILSGESICM